MGFWNDTGPSIQLGLNVSRHVMVDHNNDYEPIFDERHDYYGGSRSSSSSSNNSSSSSNSSSSGTGLGLGLNPNPNPGLG